MATDAQRDLLEHKLETLLQDALLTDVPPNPTAEEVDTLIAIEQGRAYRITIDRGPLDALSIVVRQASSVHDIKRMIQSKIERGTVTKISWRYIWRSHCLTFNGQRLLDDNAAVSQLGISQDSILKFTKLADQKYTRSKTYSCPCHLERLQSYVWSSHHARSWLPVYRSLSLS